MKTKKSKSAPKFSNRVRFSWGYFDAIACVRNGWNTSEQNFGFGPALVITCPDDVRAQHPDSAHACGWRFGYYEALGGLSHSGGSEPAWQAAVKAGLVSE